LHEGDLRQEVCTQKNASSGKMDVPQEGSMDAITSLTSPGGGDEHSIAVMPQKWGNKRLVITTREMGKD